MSDNIKAKEISQENLIRFLKDSIEKNSSIHCGFILGSGASVKSRIPSGSELSKKWYDEIKEDSKEDTFASWIKDKVIDETNLAESYTKIFAKRFEVDFRAGYEELQRYMDKAEPSIGYSFLAQFLSKTSHKFIITTNFDTMVEDALFGLKEAKPLVLGHELLSKYINPTSPTRPTIIKIHRDFLLDPYNTDDEIKELDAQWQESLKPLLKEHSMIVIGYGGNDDSLMNYLNEIKDRKPIYWCYRGDKNKLSAKITNLLNEKDFIIQIKGFDSFMLLLNDKMAFNETIIDKENINNSLIIKNAIEYAEKYKKQLEELTNEPLDKDEQKAIENLLPSSWHYQIEVNKEPLDNKKEEIYLEGLKAYPNSHELMNNYANLLYKLIKHEKAEIYYKKTLNIEPNNALYNGNYALFLQNIGKNIDAEIYFKKALEIEPNNALYNGNFAHFLQKVNKDKEAETYFKRVLEIKPNDIDINGGYATSLQKLNRNVEAEIYYKKALEIQPNNIQAHSGYANVLQTLNLFEKSEIHYKKALELESNDTINNINYAFLLQKLNRFDEAEIHYKKALTFEPNDSNFIANYANFLTKQNRNEEAETYYKKALDIEPNHANCNGNYAQLLLILGKKDEATSYIENAFKNQATENDLIVELWFYRLAHYPEYFDEAKKELDLLLDKGIKSIGWDLSRNIEQAKKEGHKDIKLLEEYAKKITNP